MPFDSSASTRMPICADPAPKAMDSAPVRPSITPPPPRVGVAGARRGKGVRAERGVGRLHTERGRQFLAHRALHLGEADLQHHLLRAADHHQVGDAAGV
jgi:hypothetical protein